MEKLIVLAVLNCLFLNSNGFLCYSCSDCNDPLNITLAKIENCNETGAACSVFFQIIVF